MLQVLASVVTAKGASEVGNLALVPSLHLASRFPMSLWQMADSGLTDLRSYRQS